MHALFIAAAVLSRAWLAHGGALMQLPHVDLPRAAAANGVTVSLFTDHKCGTPSSTTPKLTLGLNVCAQTVGLESYVFAAAPCAHGTVRSWTFDDSSCATTSSLETEVYKSDNCYGTFKDGIAVAAIMLTCDADTSEIDPSQPTSFTSVAVAPIIGAATGAPSAVSSSGSTPAGSGAGATQTATGWNSLDYGARVGIIVAISVGIPPILLGVCALYMRRR